MLKSESDTDGLNNMENKRYALRWRHHQETVVAEVGSLFRECALVDVTLACEDQRTYQAHKLVLSACSQYFQTLFAMHPAHQHPIIFLKDVNGDECEALLTFMYKGEVSVNPEQIPRILRVASSLQVRGLAEVETHSSRPSSPANTDRAMHSPSPSPSPAASPTTVCPPPKSVTPISEPSSPNPHSQMTSSTHEHGNCSHPQQPSRSLPRPTPLPQDFPNPSTYLMRPPFDLSPSGPPIPLQMPIAEHERKLPAEEKIPIPPYSSSQLRVKADLGANWDGNVEMGPLHQIRDGPRHPYLHHPIFSSFLNLDPPVSAGSPGYGVNNPPFSIRDPLNRLSGNETRIHKCDFCSRKFKRKDHLKTHVRIHTGERPYKCKICGRGFIQSQQVKIHMKVHTREDSSSLSASAVMGGSGSGGGLSSALTSLYSELSSHYGSQQNDRAYRSGGSHPNLNCDQSSEQLLGPQTDGDSENDLSCEIPDSEAKCRMADGKNFDAGTSRLFAHQNVLKNRDSTPSPERSPSKNAKLSDNRISPTRLISHLPLNYSSTAEDNCMRDTSPRGGCPLISNIKK